MAASRSAVAVTGGTGFVGAGVISALHRDGVPLRVLVRRPGADLPPGTVAVPGDLDDAAALCALVEGCSVLVHCAGSVRAHSPDEFARVNTDATARIGQLCAARGVRLVLISSLAAREPALSPYASSKHAAERALGRVPRLDWCALRPPLVYGPRDRATLPLFRMMRRGWLTVPAIGDGRFSAVYIDDLASACVELTASAVGGVFEIGDGHVAGYRWDDVAAAAAAHLHRAVRCVPVPRIVMQAAAKANQLASRLTGSAPMVYPGKVRELYHIDWVCSAEPLMRATNWRPRVPLSDGVGRSFRWYAANGWL